MRRFLILVPFIAMLLLFTACNDDNHLRVVPHRCDMAVLCDPVELGLHMNKGGEVSWWKKKGVGLYARFSSWKGINLSARAMLFFTESGEVGVCIPVADAEKLKDYLNEQRKSWGLSEPVLNDGVTYYHIPFGHDAFLLAVADDVLLAMGPAGSDELRDLQVRMARQMRHSREQSILNTLFYRRLVQLDGAAKVLARLGAFPDMLQPFFALMASGGDLSSKTVFEGELVLEGKSLNFYGRPSSLNDTERNRIELDTTLFRRILPYGDHAGFQQTALSDSAFSSHEPSALFVTNTDGPALLAQLHGNPAFRFLLGGLNMTTNADSILQTLDGNMVLRAYNDGTMQISSAWSDREIQWSEKAQNARAFVAAPIVPDTSIGMLCALSTRLFNHPISTLCFIWPPDYSDRQGKK